jgi:glucokinase
VGALGGGRPVIGLDLGGTKILALAVGPDGAVLGRALHPTPRTGRSDLVAALGRAAREACGAAGLSLRDCAGVGVGAPGPTDPGTGVVLDPPNLPADCRELPLGELLGAELGTRVAVENDANAAALGEHRYGAGRGQADMVYVTISTGIGGGVIAGGRLLRGAGLMAGEVGHMLLAPEGRDVCGCGRTGCWEAISSGTGIARQAREAGAAAPTAASVVAAAAAGDDAARRIVARAVAYNGYGLVNLLHMFSPGLIVIGGGLTHAWDVLVAPAAEWALGYAMRRAAAACRIVPTALGDLVGGLGAAAALADPEA